MPTVALGRRQTAPSPSPLVVAARLAFSVFLSDKGERITLAVGVHNYKRWCDVATGLNPDETSLVINGQYYNDGGRDWVRVRQQTEHSATSPTGTTAKAVYTAAEGNKLEANVIVE